ncbi:hypothetical protein FJZ21_01120 [Candidatus Pacearchaeota archaeon]|nr:hypothetical protein [Candidatus Pacearchaeota archaeon]
MSKTQTGLTFIALFSLGVTGILNYQSKGLDLAARLYGKAAGNDGVLQIEEKGRLLSGLGLDAKIADEGSLLIRPSEKSERLDLYIVRGSSSESAYRKIGEVEFKIAERYLLNDE